MFSRLLEIMNLPLANQISAFSLAKFYGRLKNQHYKGAVAPLGWPALLPYIRKFGFLWWKHALNLESVLQKYTCGQNIGVPKNDPNLIIKFKSSFSQIIFSSASVSTDVSQKTD